MAITKGHGNPNWTYDEIVLALDLYIKCNGKPPGTNDSRVIALSKTLRSFPHHHRAARKNSFRNAAGVAFKLQNIHQVATGKGLSNVSKTDRQVWENIGHRPNEVKRLAALIEASIEQVSNHDLVPDSIFIEGRLVTENHVRMEREPTLRKKFLATRKSLKCDLCHCKSNAASKEIQASMFECHHTKPLSMTGKTKTQLTDIALLCANCHRMVHKAISQEKRWLSTKEAIEIIFHRSNDSS